MVLWIAGALGAFAGEAHAQGTAVWRLVATVPDAEKRSGSTPQIYGDRDMGGYQRFALSPGSYTQEIRQYNADPQHSLARDWKFRFSYDAPPPVIRAGVSFDLGVTGETSGSLLDGGWSAHARFTGSGIRIDCVRLLFDGGAASLSLGSATLGAQSGYPKPIMRAEAVFRFTADASMPDEFSIVQVAGGVGPVAVFKYVKDSSGQAPATPASGAFEVYALGCDGNPARTGRLGRLVCVARVRGVPSDDPSTYEWVIDGRPVSGGSQIFFDGLAPGEHGVRVVAINNGARSRDASLNATVDGPPVAGGRPGVPVDPSTGAATSGSPITTPPKPPFVGSGGAAPPPGATTPPATTTPPKPPSTQPPTGLSQPDIVELTTDGRKIRFTRDHPKYKLIARCNELTYVAALMALVDRENAPAAYVVIMTAKQTCEVAANEEGRRKPESASRAVAEPSARVEAMLTDGAVRVEVPDARVRVLLQTPAGLITSAGITTFDVDYALATDELRVSVVSGAVDVLRANAEQPPERVVPGRPLVIRGGPPR
jgi:hypothetical protein